LCDLSLLLLEAIAYENLLGLLLLLALEKLVSSRSGGPDGAAGLRALRAAARQPADHCADNTAGSRRAGGIQYRRHTARRARNGFMILKVDSLADDVNGSSGFILLITDIDNRIDLIPVFLSSSLSKPLSL
jgi:hypothetical protein